MPAPIEFYFACVSPWSYLAIDELKRIADAHGRAVNYKPIDVGRS
jgi:2-hydroxychromene-2-carboxylate isomerase